MILRSLINKNLPEVFEKFIEFGLPFEYYFAEKLLSMLAGYFNTEMVFRIWDLLFLEASSIENSRSIWVLITALFVLIANNKDSILNC